MRDEKHLYFKIDAFNDLQESEKSPSRIDEFPREDRVEMVLCSGSDTYYFALGADGGTYLLKNWDTTRSWSNETQVRYFRAKGRWSALLAVPLSDLGAASGKVDLDGKFCRVVNPKTPEREESAYNGRSIFNDHPLLRSPLEFDE